MCLPEILKGSESEGAMDREEASAREWCKQNGYVMMRESVYEQDVARAYFEGQSASTSEIPNKWIPVSERLPKPFSFVNCTCHSLIDDREDWVVETAYLPQPPNSPYSDWGNIPMLNHCECEVTAWIYRDIPEPYKAESEDTE